MWTLGNAAQGQNRAKERAKVHAQLYGNEFDVRISKNKWLDLQKTENYHWTSQNRTEKKGKWLRRKCDGLKKRNEKLICPSMNEIL